MAPALKYADGHNPEPSQPLETYEQFQCWLQLFASSDNYTLACGQLMEENTSQSLDFGLGHVTCFG